MTNKPGNDELQCALRRTRRWYEQTKNPLYVWEAINECLHAGESLPDWCLDYLKIAAQNLYWLSCGVDFRDTGTAEKISSDDAFKLTLNALSMSRQGKRNAFASLLDDRDDMRAALDDFYDGRDACVTKRKRLGYVTLESARRRAARGKDLLNVKRRIGLPVDAWRSALKTD